MNVEAAANNAGFTVDQLGEKYTTVMSEIKQENNKKDVRCYCCHGS